tara:strand:- start:46294 stop:48378 length:2085 start_codon:yes stop_codon:yes gene_type:complete
MAAIPSNLTSLDFSEIRESIRSYLRTRDEFTDYDFDGSAASYLLDVLSYNTYYAAFNANMAMNEAFLESATIRDNVVKIAKQLNYTPRSVKAPKACVRFAVQTETVGSGTTYPGTVTLQAGDVFVSAVSGQGYTFTLPSALQATVDQSTGIATFSKVVINQGNTLTYQYVVDDVKKRDYLIPSDQVDTDLLSVSISPNAQSEEIDTYNLVQNIVDVDGTTRGYFLEETDDQRYNVVFGDGVICRQLIAGEVIKLKYVRTEGTAANGCKQFSFIGRVIDSESRLVSSSNISLVTIDGAQDGEDVETTLSIKFNAPRAFNSQNRAVTESDYEFITKKVYPQAKSVTAYGGERLSPPIYGKVYISIRTKSGALLNTTTKKRIKNNLLKYSIAAIEPVIVDPITLYIRPKTWAFFDGNKTTLSNNEVASKVLGAVDQYNSQAESTRFNGRIDLSAYQSMIDSSDPSISGNITHMSLGMNIENFNFGQTFTQCIDFNNEIANPNDLSGGAKGTDGAGDGTCIPKYSSVKTGTFYSTGYTEGLLSIQGGANANQISSTSLLTNDTTALLPVNIRDDGYGNLIMVTKVDEAEVTLKKNVGTVDYKSGQVCVGPVDIASTPDGTNRVPVTVIPASGNINIGTGLDPTIFNPTVQTIDYTIDGTNVPTFDPFDFNAINFDGTSINIIDYPTTVFEIPEFNSCF